VLFVIDSQFAPLAPKIRAAIAMLSNQPVAYVVNTHWHGDHTGANEQFADAGAVIAAHDNVRTRMANAPKPSADGALPVITFSETATFHYNDHEIHVAHPNNAHTDGDVMLHFRDVDVIHAGDVMFNGMFPFIDLGSGGSVDGFIAGMEQLAEMAGPGTKIIPGHGPVASERDVARSIVMLKDARARVAKLIAKGNDLDAVKAAAPLADYDAEWGWVFITTERFTELLYAGLKQ
jgi:cyclase